MAKKYLNRVRGDHDLDDLINVANVAIWQATLDFDQRRGLTFGQWARFKIRGALRQLQEKSWRGMRVGFVLSMHPKDDDSRGIDLATPEPSALHLLCAIADRARLHQAVASLPQREKEAIELCYFEGMSLSEAATALDRSREAINQRRMKAVRTLARRYRRDRQDG